jgi:hypothetical protein
MEMGDLDRIAEERVAKWLSEEPTAPDGVRPFDVIVRAAQNALNAHADGLRLALANVQRDFVEELQRRAHIEKALGEMDVRDALLIRNEFAPNLDEQQLTVELLQERHGLVFGDVSRNALDQRKKRSLKKGHDGLRRRRVALLDLLRESAAVGGGR